MLGETKPACADIDNYQALVNAVCFRNAEEVRKILDKSEFITNDNLFQLLCGSDKKSNCTGSCVCSDTEQTIVYMLIDYGFNVEEVDEKGNTCLYYAVEHNHSNLCEVLLQSGADMWANTQFNISVFDYVQQTSSDSIKNVFDKFYPGVWKAVECENIYQVRKLINLWCQTDLYKDDVSLKDIALKSGHEEIISLILGIYDTMSDRGAPILYYLIKSSDVETIKLFIKYGCPLYTIMQDDLGFDMPVLFSALKLDTSIDVIKALLPREKPYQEEMLFKILYKGQTVLEVALAKNVEENVFSLLVDRGGPLLLCERNQMNQTVRDLAMSSGDTKYVDVIDKNVLSWIIEPREYSGRRQKLALYGWNLENVEEQLLKKLNTEEYFCYAKELQKGLQNLSVTVENGDVEKYFQLKVELSNIEEPQHFLWSAKVLDDGMPLLHRAILHNRFEIVNDILLEKPLSESIDNLFDQNRRTALHYAYASSAMKEVRILLMTYGCSEHVLDKVNREPLDFRSKQDTPVMMQLLDRLKSKNFQQIECDPWAIEMYNNQESEDEEGESPSSCLMS